MRRVTPHVKKILAGFLAEDAVKDDVTSALLSKNMIAAKIVTREAAVISGTAYAKEIFAVGGSKCTIIARDGQRASKGDTVMSIRGRACNILARERTALNLLSRMCGIATATADLASFLPPGVHVYATRKTAPGLRIFDKEAVEAGGGRRHRMNLGGSVMIKDNHIAAAMSSANSHRRVDRRDCISHLIRAARNRYGSSKSVEIEVEDAQDAMLAAREGADTIMLDNFTPARAKAAIRRIREAGLRDASSIEVSGGITRKNIRAYAACGADMISAGFITNSVTCTDLSLEV